MKMEYSDAGLPGKEFSEKTLENKEGRIKDIRAIQKSIQDHPNVPEKPNLPFTDPEEGEVKNTFQRRPQFRLNENRQWRNFFTRSPENNKS